MQRESRRSRGVAMPMALAGAAAILGIVGGHRMLTSPAQEPPAFAWRKAAPAEGTTSADKIEMAKDALRRADAVCFDVDSTVVVTEGIDLLAACFGVYDEVSALTKTAMEGNMKFQDAMAQRLEIMQPTLEGVKKCLQKEKPRFSPGMQKVMKRLQDRGVQIYLVSGGFVVMIEPVAKLLGIPSENIFANTILFDDEGNYKDFDRAAFTSRSGGKPAVVKHLKKTKGYDTVIMFGDGATDMDARPPADAFIGYGGVQVRQSVRDGADWFVTHWRDVLSILE